MNPIRRNLFLICTVILSWLALFPGCKECRADNQAKTASKTADICLQILTNTNRNDFHRYWTSGPGMEGYVLAPFYLGEFQLGTRVISFESRPAESVDYLSVFVYAGWGMSWAFPKNITGFAGLNIGSDQMFFEFEDRPGLKRESEFGIHLNSRLRVPLYERWAVVAGASYSEIFTRHRIRLVFVSAGVSRSFELPTWLREFLK